MIEWVALGLAVFALLHLWCWFERTLEKIDAEEDAARERYCKRVPW